MEKVSIYDKNYMAFSLFSVGVNPRWTLTHGSHYFQRCADNPGSCSFEKCGSTAQEANEVATNLVMANLSGHDSHGVGMAPRYVDAVLAGEFEA